jgi:hypothetical protein
MAKDRGRRPIAFESMDERPGFRCTADQFDFLEEARIAAGETSISAWLRTVAEEASVSLLGRPWPARKVTNPPRKKAR